MLSVFKRMAEGVLAVMGEDSFLRGDVPCKCNIEHGVQIVGEDENVVVERSIATISAVHLPKVGNTLSHPDGNYRLDAEFQDNGANPRFILLKQPP